MKSAFLDVDAAILKQVLDYMAAKSVVVLSSDSNKAGIVRLEVESEDLPAECAVKTRHVTCTIYKVLGGGTYEDLRHKWHLVDHAVH